MHMCMCNVIFILQKWHLDKELYNLYFVVKRFEANVCMYYIMNIQDYFEREAKKYECVAKCAQKFAKGISNQFHLQLEYINDTLTGISEQSFALNNVHEKKRLL